jgi:hypothetical protein
MVGALTREWVFGYGSLVPDLASARTRSRDGDGFVADLRGHRRVWGVAMDNREVVPGYKLYLDPDGGRPAVWVAFLDLAPAGTGSVNGVLSQVDAVGLELLDRRERSYERIDVSDWIADPPGRTWAYLGSAAGRGRRAAGERAGALVVQRDYLDAVRAGFRMLGPQQLARFDASTEAPGPPVLDLLRVDLPEEPAGP